MNEEIECIGRLGYKDCKDNMGKNTSAIIYIPEEILKQKKHHGITIYLNLFWVCKDLLKFRGHIEHKIAISSNPKDVRVGDRDYNSSYIKMEIVLPEEELIKISELIKCKGGEMNG